MISLQHSKTCITLSRVKPDERKRMPTTTSSCQHLETSQHPTGTPRKRVDLSDNFVIALFKIQSMVMRQPSGGSGFKSRLSTILCSFKFRLGLYLKQNCKINGIFICGVGQILIETKYYERNFTFVNKISGPRLSDSLQVLLEQNWT